MSSSSSKVGGMKKGLNLERAIVAGFSFLSLWFKVWRCVVVINWWEFEIVSTISGRLISAKTTPFLSKLNYRNFIFLRNSISFFEIWKCFFEFRWFGRGLWTRYTCPQYSASVANDCRNCLYRHGGWMGGQTSYRHFNLKSSDLGKSHANQIRHTNSSFKVPRTPQHPLRRRLVVQTVLNNRSRNSSSEFGILRCCCHHIATKNGPVLEVALAKKHAMDS